MRVITAIEKKIRRIPLGVHLKDKLRIVYIEFLRATPNHSIANLVLAMLCDGLAVQVDGLKYILLDYQSFNVICNRDFEPFMHAWFKPQKNEVLVDIGSHIGKYVLSFARNGCKVVAIEPHPQNFLALQHNITINNLRNVVALNFACWNQTEKLKLFLGDGSGHHSLKINYECGMDEIEAVPADNVLGSLNLQRVDWIKIDVEDAEHEVLLGLQKTIRKYQPKLIIEVRDANLKNIRKFMRENNYALIRISGQTDMAYFLCCPLNEAQWNANFSKSTTKC